MHSLKAIEELPNEDNHRNYLLDVFFKIKATIEESGPPGTVSSLHKIKVLFK